jgi:F-type H+-transporting ATPase subunit b
MMMTAAPVATTATTEANGALPHGEESFFAPSNPEFWVYAGITIFLLLAIFVAKAPKKIAETLDQRIADTRRQLDEAKAIRAEAEALLADAKAKAKASAGDAASIVAHAEQEAAALIAKAEADAADLVARRGKMAEDKIGAAERAAVAEVRAKAADVAAKAAGRIIAETHGAADDAKLVDKTIAGLSRLN